MPDASGRFRGITVPADAWERVFGKPEPQRCRWPLGSSEALSVTCALTRGHDGAHRSAFERPSALQVAIRALRKDDAPGSSASRR